MFVFSALFCFAIGRYNIIRVTGSIKCLRGFTVSELEQARRLTHGKGKLRNVHTAELLQRVRCAVASISNSCFLIRSVSRYCLFLENRVFWGQWPLLWRRVWNLTWRWRNSHRGCVGVCLAGDYPSTRYFHAKWPLLLSDLNQNWNAGLSTYLIEILNIDFHENPFRVLELFRANGQTDMAKLIRAFLQYLIFECAWKWLECFVYYISHISKL